MAGKDCLEAYCDQIEKNVKNVYTVTFSGTGVVFLCNPWVIIPKFFQTLT